jgi:peptidyl-dipeptidase Dcp
MLYNWATKIRGKVEIANSTLQNYGFFTKKVGKIRAFFFRLKYFFRKKKNTALVCENLSIFVLQKRMKLKKMRHKNPLFFEYTTVYQSTPFNEIENRHYLPAFEEGIRLFKKDMDTIADNPEEPTYENIILALERSGRMVRRVASAFFGIFNATIDDETMEIAQTISPSISETMHYMYQNQKLFQRLKTVYLKKDTLHLPEEEECLLVNGYKEFMENGAGLKAEDRKKYQALMTELTLLSLDFEGNTLKDENEYELLLTDETDISGIPADLCDQAAQEARERGKTGWLFTLSAPSYAPFMRYADNRALRQQMYKARLSIGNKDNANNNREIITKIVNKRLEIARLMGFDNYAAYSLRNKMAENKQTVLAFLQQLLENYKPLAEREYETLQNYATERENDPSFVLMPWDWTYYAEKLKKRQFNVNDEMTRPYFELKHVRKSIFGLANELYGITFKKNAKIPVYHKDVTAYEVQDVDKSLLGILYADFYSRKTKQSGAWMNEIKGQFVDENGVDHRPHVMIAMNFRRPTKNHPTLLTYNEVKTFLHEFGHALHGLFSQCRYETISGTKVKHDFVELPSQIMENWLEEQAFLDQIGVHYKTGRKIPAELVKNLIDASNFNVGYDCCRQVSLALLDMDWHTIETPFDGDIERFEKKAMKKAAILPEVAGAVMSCCFGHIFSGEYAAGYYGYKWAEVLDADAFSLFKERGIFDRTTAQSFRNNILNKGDTADPNVLYVRFRGHKPTIDALLKRNGIAIESAPKTLFSEL